MKRDQRDETLAEFEAAEQPEVRDLAKEQHRSEDDLGSIIARKIDEFDRQKRSASQLEKAKQNLRRELEEIASLDPIDYDRKRKSAAKTLGIRVGTLDRLARSSRAASATPSGADISLPDIDPWPASVDGAELLDEIALALRRYVVFADQRQADAIALWVAHCHVFDVFHHTPRLNITSPQKRCGKTLLLDVIGTLVPRPLATENLAIAAFFRVIAEHRPTVLADEYDSYLSRDDTLRSAMNAGHRRGGQVLRCVGDESQVKAFPVFAPVVLGGIRELPGTLHDRSIVIALKRATSPEMQSRMRFDGRHTAHEAELARKLARWTADNRAQLERADPDVGELFNRAADNWRPLHAIADKAGAKWPQRAREAMRALTSADDDADSKGEMVLADIRAVFEEKNCEAMHSSTLVEALNALEGCPWSDWAKGRGLSKTALAWLLKPFKIRSRQLKLEGINRHGYRFGDFLDAFSRYIPAENATSLQASSGTGFSEIENATEAEAVAFENPRKRSSAAAGSEVADETGERPEEDEYARFEREAIQAESEEGKC